MCTQPGNEEPQEDAEGSPGAVVAYLAMQALLAAGDVDNAQAELLAAVASPGAGLDLCMAAIKVHAGGGAY